MDVCTVTDCEFSQDRKGGGVKKVKRAGEGQEGRKELQWMGVYV